MPLESGFLAKRSAAHCAGEPFLPRVDDHVTLS